MSEDRLDEAAMLLAEARLNGRTVDRLPEHCRPRDETEAYAVQDRLHKHLTAEGRDRLLGHKIGCTTPVMQHYLGIDSPCAGGLFEASVTMSGSRLRHGDFRHVGVECEIAVRLAKDVRPTPDGHQRDSIGEAVQSCMAAIEIVDDRYLDYRSLDTSTLIADDFFNAGAVLGPEVQDWTSLDLADLEGRMSVDGDIVGEGVGAAILGHPLEALAWLANRENARGRSLRAGDLVLLGSLVQTQWVSAGSHVAISIDGLGSASVRFD
ncbi:MAG: fumarylacetoacetate hydrolase family protein [Pseudomonadota bacterium]